jgi:hypothetical protein
MSEPEWPPIRIFNLLICAGVAAYFVAALASPGVPQPHGPAGRFIFWAGGPCALFILAIEGFVNWADWHDDRHVRRTLDGEP